MRARSAVLILDMINDLVHSDGKRAADGFAEEIARRGVLVNTAAAIDRARRCDIPVIYVVIGFPPGYRDWPVDSPLFQASDDARIPRLGTWGTQVHEALRPMPEEDVVFKRRVSPFYRTGLDRLLRRRGIDTVLLAGVSTDLAVLSTARDAHDRDYRVEVFADATAAHDEAAHDAALMLASRTAAITSVAEALPLP